MNSKLKEVSSEKVDLSEVLDKLDVVIELITSPEEETVDTIDLKLRCLELAVSSDMAESPEKGRGKLEIAKEFYNWIKEGAE